MALARERVLSYQRRLIQPRAGLTDIEIRETHRVHDQASSAIVRARKPELIA